MTSFQDCTVYGGREPRLIMEEEKRRDAVEKDCLHMRTKQRHSPRFSQPGGAKSTAEERDARRCPSPK